MEDQHMAVEVRIFWKRYDDDFDLSSKLTFYFYLV
jgi:hypothetical protein